MDIPHLGTPPERIEAFCRRWKVSEFALFGSILTDEFRPDSDVDVLVTFAGDAHWSLFDLSDMRDELMEMFGRQVDMVLKRALRNPFRKERILSTYQVIYAA